jgi:hypothetical protein
MLMLDFVAAATKVAAVEGAVALFSLDHERRKGLAVNLRRSCGGVAVRVTVPNGKGARPPHPSCPRVTNIPAI